MHKSKKSWLSLLLLLFVLAIPMRASADFFRFTGGSGGGGASDSGDPDNPTPAPPGIAPGQRSGGTGRNDGNFHVNRPIRSDSWLLRRYLTMLSGLRSFYLRF